MAIKSAKTVFKRSTVPGKAPVTTDLDLGEVAINTYDGSMYIKKNNGAESVVLINNYNPANVAITGGSINGALDVNVTKDVLVNGMTVGVGGGNNSDNLAIGLSALSNLEGGYTDSTTSFNIALGSRALASLTHASNNVGIGSLSLNQATTGGFNMAFGAHALQQLTTGTTNIAIGFAAGGGGFSSPRADLTTGKSNIYIGSQVYPLTSSESNWLRLGTSGIQSVAIGSNALNVSTVGQLVAIGNNALAKSIQGSGSTAIGSGTLQNAGQSYAATAIIVGRRYFIQSVGTTDFTTCGAANNNVGTNFHATAVPTGTGTVTTCSSRNSLAIGHNSQSAVLYGSGGTSVGASCLSANVWGDLSTAFGTSTLSGALAAEFTTAFGGSALSDYGKSTNATAIVSGNMYLILTVGTTDFTAIGSANNTVGTTFTATGAGTGTGTVAPLGYNNTALGYRAGNGDTTTGRSSGNSQTYSSASGQNNTFLGGMTAGLNATDRNQIVIGAQARGIGSNSTVIGNSSTVVTKVFGKLLINDAPASAIGAAGDVAGMFAVDANYMYHCVANYDGTTSIWRRIAGSSW